MTKRILVIHVTRIGDTLLATPAIRAIAEAHPEAHLTVLAHPKRAEILRHLPFIDEVGSITKQRAWLKGRLSPPAYDLAFVFGQDRALVAYALRAARKVIAFRQGDASIDERLATSVVPPPRHSCHAVDALLALPEAVGIHATRRRLAYHVTEAETRWAVESLARWLPAGAGPLIGLQVASFPTKAWRDWPLEHFIGLAEHALARHPHAHFLILGGSGEHERTGALHARFPAHTTLLAGRLTLRETAAVMSRLDAYVGVDTGPTHLMGTFDIPLVALYHDQSPAAIYGPLEHPCLFAIERPADGPTGGMADISIDTVAEATEKALAHPCRSIS